MAEPSEAESSISESSEAETGVYVDSSARKRRDGELDANQANQIRDALRADARSGAK